MSDSLSPLATQSRLPALDAVRAFALLLGVVLHLSMSWLPYAQFFYITHEAQPAPALAATFYLIHAFRMLVFFLLAGLFGRLLLQRLGSTAFLKDRLRRILLPLLVAWPLVFAAIVAVVVWNVWLVNNGTLPEQSPPGPAFTPDDFPLTHLWFLWVLAWFYPLLLGLRWLGSRLDPRGRLLHLLDRLVKLLLWPGAVLLLALPLAFALHAQPQWFAWFGIPTPDRSLYPNLPALLGYGMAFTLGWLLHRQLQQLELLRRWGWLHLLLGSAVLLGCLLWLGATPVLIPAARSTATLLYALAYAFAGFSISLGLIGVALRWLHRPSASLRYLADASYWIYIVHLPLVMAAQVLMSRLHWPWWLEYPLALVACLAVSLGSYALCVRHTRIGRWLAGRPAAASAALPAGTAVLSR